MTAQPGGATGPEARIAELEAAVAARDEFLAVAAHELRNPMTPILAHVQRLRRRLRAGEVDLRQADETLVRIEGLVEGYLRRATTLLDVSRLAAGQVVLGPVAVDVAEVVRGLAAAIEPAALYAGSTLEVAAPATLPARLDRQALEQIVDNLLTNAVKYGSGRPIRVSAAADAGTVRVAVIDGGAGISEADRSRIFERFERAMARGSGVGGFGVGLWVSGRLAQAMGGAIAVTDTPGGGSTFTVALPLGLGEEPS